MKQELQDKAKFKVGDVVKVSNGIIGRIYGIGILQPLEYLVLSTTTKGGWCLKGGWYSESDIELYTEPHNVEDEEVSKPTHFFCKTTKVKRKKAQNLSLPLIK
ncbi:MAG: hypothetical protein K2H16_07635 [Prevotella sp.]|nr:hypothetical protein [Prevotella sp.]